MDSVARSGQVGPRSAFCGLPVFLGRRGRLTARPGSRALRLSTTRPSSGNWHPQPRGMGTHPMRRQPRVSAWPWTIRATPGGKARHVPPEAVQRAVRPTHSRMPSRSSITSGARSCGQGHGGSSMAVSETHVAGQHPRHQGLCRLMDARRPRWVAGPSLPPAAAGGHSWHWAGDRPRVASGPAPTGRASPVNLTDSPFDTRPSHASAHRAPRFLGPSPAPREFRRVGGFRPAVTISVAGCRGPGLRENPEFDWLAAGATRVERVRAAVQRAERGEGTAVGR